MVHKRRSIIAQSSAVVAISAGVTVAIVTSVILSGLLALLITKDSLNQTMMGVGVNIILFISVLAGTFTAAGSASQKKGIAAAVVAVLFYLILLGSNILFLDGNYESVTGKIISGSLAFLVMCLVSLRGKNEKKKRIKRYSR